MRCVMASMLSSKSTILLLIYLNDTAYKTGDKLPNSGRVRVTVSRANIKVDYIRSYLTIDETKERTNGEIAYSYTLSSGDR
ncbi:MAG: hypothetical protein WCL39_07180, partial [Armatimonadota bacterium]